MSKIHESDRKNLSEIVSLRVRQVRVLDELSVIEDRRKVLKLESEDLKVSLEEAFGGNMVFAAAVDACAQTEIERQDREGGERADSVAENDAGGEESPAGVASPSSSASSAHVEAVKPSRRGRPRKNSASSSGAGDSASGSVEGKGSENPASGSVEGAGSDQGGAASGPSEVPNEGGSVGGESQAGSVSSSVVESPKEGALIAGHSDDSAGLSSEIPEVDPEDQEAYLGAVKRDFVERVEEPDDFSPVLESGEDEDSVREMMRMVPPMEDDPAGIFNLNDGVGSLPLVSGDEKEPF